MDTTKWAFAAATTSALIFACTAPAGDDRANVGAASDRLFANQTTFWPNPSAIPVCWETDGYTKEKEWVRLGIVSTWETAAPRIHFAGWAKCAATSPGLHIVVDAQEGPHTKELGFRLNGMKDGMSLDFTFAGGFPAECKQNDTIREKCVKAIAIHEFGHALGFEHEQDRPDTPSSCTDGRQEGVDATTVGPWDLMSVMNYCNPDYMKFPIALSPGDVDGVRKMYPSDPADGAVVPLDGDTADAESDAPAPDEDGGAPPPPDDRPPTADAGGVVAPRDSGANTTRTPDAGSSAAATPTDSSGCACRVAPAERPGGFGAVLLAVGLFLARRRKD